jgi:hypothetical protein
MHHVAGGQRAEGIETTLFLKIRDALFEGRFLNFD